MTRNSSVKNWQPTAIVLGTWPFGKAAKLLGCLNDMEYALEAPMKSSIVKIIFENSRNAVT